MSCYFKGLIHILLKSMESTLIAKAFVSGLYNFKLHNRYPASGRQTIILP